MENLVYGIMIIHKNSGKMKIIERELIMDINELKKLLEKNQREILDLWRSL